LHEGGLIKWYLALLIAVLLLYGPLFYGYASSEPETISIAFFNALTFGYGESCCKDMSLSAHILSGYDIIGLVEVMKDSSKCDTCTQDDFGHLNAPRTTLEEQPSLPWNYVISPYPQGKIQTQSTENPSTW